MIGAIAGLAGDRTSLGFVAETEKQVVEHLESHLQQLPADDERSRRIVEQMKSDEDAAWQRSAQCGRLGLPGTRSVALMRRHGARS